MVWHHCWHPCRGAYLMTFYPVVSLRSTTGYRLRSLRDHDRKRGRRTSENQGPLNEEDFCREREQRTQKRCATPTGLGWWWGDEYQGRPHRLGQPFAVMRNPVGVGWVRRTAVMHNPYRVGEVVGDGYQGRPHRLGQPFAVMRNPVGVGWVRRTAVMHNPVGVGWVQRPLSTSIRGGSAGTHCPTIVVKPRWGSASGLWPSSSEAGRMRSGDAQTGMSVSRWEWLEQRRADRYHDVGVWLAIWRKAENAWVRWALRGQMKLMLRLAFSGARERKTSFVPEKWGMAMAGVKVSPKPASTRASTVPSCEL